VEQELLTLPEHLSSPLVLSGVRVTRNLVLCVCFVDRCLSFWPLCCLFFFDLRILITPFVSSNSSLLLFSDNISELWKFVVSSQYNKSTSRLNVYYRMVVTYIYTSIKQYLIIRCCTDLLYCEETTNFHNSEILSEKRKQTVSLCFIFVLYHNLYLHEALVSILLNRTKGQTTIYKTYT
jgi:hypothetical protein